MRIKPPEADRCAAPSPEALDGAASILARAQHPVIITNWGGRSTGVMPALTAPANRYAIPVVEYRNRYIAMPTHHPMMAGGNPDAFVCAPPPTVRELKHEGE